MFIRSVFCSCLVPCRSVSWNGPGHEPRAGRLNLGLVSKVGDHLPPPSVAQEICFFRVVPFRVHFFACSCPRSVSKSTVPCQDTNILVDVAIKVGRPRSISGAGSLILLSRLKLQAGMVRSVFRFIRVYSFRVLFVSRSVSFRVLERSRTRTQGR